MGSESHGGTMLTDRSNPAEAAIMDLYNGRKLTCGLAEVGALSPNARRLLSVLWTRRKELASKGAEQGRTARQFYIAANEEAEPAAPRTPKARPLEAPDETPPGPAPRRWRVRRLSCQSIRGIAPLGVPFEWSLDGHPTLLYGTNGSGKSSLLNAIAWVLTGKVVTDGEEEVAAVPLYARGDREAGPSKVRDWPVIHTLPGEEDPATVAPDCWAQLRLAADGGDELFLRRRHHGGLEESPDGESWRPCPSLAAHGITPLDLQLSLSAAAMFSHKSLRGATGVQHLLAMLLGFEGLDDVGALAASLTPNLTRVATDEQRQAEAKREARRTHLLGLQEGLREGHALRGRLAQLALGDAPTVEALEELARQAEAASTDALGQLASLIGLDVPEGSAPTGLADALVDAVRLLDGPWEEVFRGCAALRTAAVVPADGGVSSSTAIDQLAIALDAFVGCARARIAERHAWWLEETKAGSRKPLLIQVARYYRPEDGQCPVCEQSVRGLDVAQDLAQLAGASDDLREGLTAFFQTLTSELGDAAPPSVLAHGERDPGALLRADWSALLRRFDPILAPVTARTAEGIAGVVRELPAVDFAEDVLLPAGAGAAFAGAATGFLAHVHRARRGVSLLRWAEAHLPDIEARLRQLVTATDGTAEPSLLITLGRGRTAAEDARPVSAVHAGLVAAVKERGELAKLERGVAAIDEMKAALSEIKPLRDYANAVVTKAFGEIEATTIAHFGTLYFSPNTHLSPSRIEIGRKDRSVEAILKTGRFEVAGQHFSNTGQLRALALAFYFAILAKHPHGLGFVLMDDPILSLDEDNRREWSNHLLQPALETTQFIVATHQLHYLNRCRSDFHVGRVLEINPRRPGFTMTFRDGDRLKRAEALLEGTWQAAANEMRKYREDLLVVLDSHSPTPFFNQKQLSESLRAYSTFAKPHPLAHKHQETIAHGLQHKDVTVVLDPGSHGPTEADVSPHDARKCLAHLKELDVTFRNEVERLRRHGRELRRAAHSAAPPAIAPDPRPRAPAPPLHFPAAKKPDGAPDRLRFRLVGTAAAQTHGLVVDFGTPTEAAEFRSREAVLVGTDALLPVADRGDWALVADEDVEVGDGDLAAVYDRAKNCYLRRVWSSGDQWLLEAINPLSSARAVMVPREDCAIRKVLGVVAQPLGHRQLDVRDPSREWSPHGAFKDTLVADGEGIRIRGSSMEPIARDGQVVLVGSAEERLDALPRGGLFVVETTEAHVGNVIKRVFVNKDQVVLVSPNPVEPHEPIVVPRERVASVRRVRGVLFDATVLDDDPQRFPDE
ncbi:MAG: hypothetical protein JWM10_3149 [Myxococcaceae bacterium]|nr:hypothetical protein [Myxococcaceae bacterium]